MLVKTGDQVILGIGSSYRHYRVVGLSICEGTLYLEVEEGGEKEDPSEDEGVLS